MNDYCVKKEPDKLIISIHGMPDDVKFNIYEFCIDYTDVLNKEKEMKEKIIYKISLIIFFILCTTIGTLITGKISVVMLMVNLLLGYLVLLLFLITLTFFLYLPCKIIIKFQSRD